MASSSVLEPAGRGRTRLLLRSGLVALLVLLGAVVVPAPSLAQAGPNPIQIENAKPGTTNWELPGMGPHTLPTPSTEIEGYASQISVAPGDTLQLHVSTASNNEQYRIEIYRLGWYGGDGGRLIACLPSCTTTETGATQSTPAARIPIPGSWTRVGR